MAPEGAVPWLRHASWRCIVRGKGVDVGPLSKPEGQALISARPGGRRCTEWAENRTVASMQRFHRIRVGSPAQPTQCNGTAQLTQAAATLAKGISIQRLGLELLGKWYNMYMLKKDINPALSKS